MAREHCLNTIIQTSAGAGARQSQCNEINTNGRLSCKDDSIEKAIINARNIVKSSFKCAVCVMTSFHEKKNGALTLARAAT